MSGLRVYQDLANGSKFQFGMFSLNFQLLLRAPGKGGAYDVRAAIRGGRTLVPSLEIHGGYQSGCLSVSPSSARPNAGRYRPKFNSKSLGTP
jgi:hypothetical protein